MSDSLSPDQRWNDVVRQIAKLGPMHPGSICQQCNSRRAKDGTISLSRPYTIHTFKVKGKTLTRRLRTEESIERCRRQTQNFQQFQALVGQLVEIGKERAVAEPAAASKKNSAPPSRRSKRPKRRGSSRV